MIIAVEPKRKNPPPDGLPTCGNFTWTLEEFNKKMEYNPGHPKTASVAAEHCQCLNKEQLVGVVVWSAVGFILVVVIPISCSIRYCTTSRKVHMRRQEAPIVLKQIL